MRPLLLARRGSLSKMTSPVEPIGQGGKHISAHHQRDYQNNVMQYGLSNYFLCGEWAGQQAAADLAIDVYPYSSGVTCRDAFWTGISGARCVQAGYVMRDSGGTIIKNATYQGAGTDGAAADMGSQAYRNEWVASIISQIRDNDGAQGVFIDDLGQSSHFLTGTPALYPTQPLFRAAMEEFVADVSSQLSAAGLKIMFNLGAYWGGADGVNGPKFDNGDASKDWGTIPGTAGHKVMIEPGLQSQRVFEGDNTPRFMGPEYYNNWDGWVSVITYLEDHDVDWVGITHPGVGGDSPIGIYTKASALLFQNRPGSSTMIHCDDISSTPFGPKISADMGAPLGVATLSGQTWTRYFTNGNVTVNPYTGTASITVV